MNGTVEHRIAALAAPEVAHRLAAGHAVILPMGSTETHGPALPMGDFLLAEAIALGHDCGHGPGGHASEDAFDAFVRGGYEHGPWGADVVLTGLNLCAETLDGIRNHSWSRPAPTTVEGEIVSWADRIAYCAHDFEDAVHAGIVREADLPAEVVEVSGRTRRQLHKGVVLRHRCRRLPSVARLTPVQTKPVRAKCRRIVVTKTSARERPVVVVVAAAAVQLQRRHTRQRLK